MIKLRLFVEKVNLSVYMVDLQLLARMARFTFSPPTIRMKLKLTARAGMLGSIENPARNHF